jgi:hypothetical protein
MVRLCFVKEARGTLWATVMLRCAALALVVGLTVWGLRDRSRSRGLRHSKQRFSPLRLGGRVSTALHEVHEELGIAVAVAALTLVTANGGLVCHGVTLPDKILKQLLFGPDNGMRSLWRSLGVKLLRLGSTVHMIITRLLTEECVWAWRSHRVLWSFLRTRRWGYWEASRRRGTDRE